MTIASKEYVWGIDYDNIAKSIIDMARYVDRVRPSMVLLPLTSGCVTGKLVFEALRNNVNVPAKEYDPPAFPLVLNHYGEIPAINEVTDMQLKRMEETKRNSDFNRIYQSKQDSLMIIDHTNICASVQAYMKSNMKSLKRIGKPLHVNLLAGKDRNSQMHILSENGLDNEKGIYFHFSRIKREKIPFDDYHEKTGIKGKYYIDERGDYFFDYFPVISSNASIKQQKKALVYESVKKALDKAKLN